MPEYQGRKYHFTESRTERFFFTKDFPHQWTTGPGVFHFDPQTYEDIRTLERAKELSEQYFVGGYGEDRCVTTYGVEYGVFPGLPVWDDEEPEENADSSN